MNDFSQGQVMLTLALLTCRSIWDPKTKNHQGKAKAIRRGLDVLVRELADEVENLDYSHLGEDYSTKDGTQKHVIEFSGPLQQDASSYLGLLGLDKVMNLQDILGVKNGNN